MQVTCKCLNVIINSKGTAIETYNLSSKGSQTDHPFFNENIGFVELLNIHKEQPALVEVDICGDWVINRCLNCGVYTHALDASTAVVLVSRALLTKPQEIAAMKSSEKYSPAFNIVIESSEEDVNVPVTGVHNTAVGAGLQQQLTEWIKRETALTEERVRQYSEQQYEALDQLRTRVHRDHHILSRIVAISTKKSQVEAAEAWKRAPQISNATSPKPTSPLQSKPILPDPLSAIAQPKKSAQVANRPKNLPRKPSVDAEGLFDLDGMDGIDDNTTETFPSEDEELSDTDDEGGVTRTVCVTDSGSHDEGIHIPRHVTTVYAKSLPVNVPTFMNQLGSEDSPNQQDYGDSEDPMDIAASIKALAKSVHGDAVFGDLPRPRFSSQI
ncbi:uncharacterized protein LOC124371852 isoform X1 [Homalodisca vitripennis]|uniref:uncharacterized protein LOC124371852 isoform X1 n=1 Tax=Homalodisca vitripennis TaxID=197043 RepID=UPI001EEAAD2E|nr:uncharacterized protein LOC124371852 isoform X1 [Homalodisca vitripennis]